jgi:hypothetical protein
LRKRKKILDKDWTRFVAPSVTKRSREIFAYESRVASAATERLELSSKAPETATVASSEKPSVKLLRKVLGMEPAPDAVKSRPTERVSN